MAHLYGSLAADWVEGGSPYGDSTPHDYSARRGHPDSIPTAPLHPPGPVSVQSDIQYTAGWLENKADHVVELSAADGPPPVGLNAQHYLNSPNRPAPTFPLDIDIATDAPIDAFSNQLEAPWFYGSRVSHQPDSCSSSC
jgi:hypothetical protein